MNPHPSTLSQWLSACALPPLEARLLAQYATGYSHAQLITRGQDLLPSDVQAVMDELTARRRAGEPIAYLLGHREFYGRRFTVSPAVLIPRPETEHLLEAALLRLPEHGRLWDLGTGSGIIAISAKLERPDAAVFASDISAEALAVARSNAAALDADVCFAQGSWFDAATAFQAACADKKQPENLPPFDILAANPPYIEAGDPHLQQGDLRFEPPAALTDFGDGLACLHTLAARAPEFLTPGGWLLVEHGFNQGTAVRQLFQAAGLLDIKTLPDLAGLDRVTLGRKAA